MPQQSPLSELVDHDLLFGVDHPTLFVDGPDLESGQQLVAGWEHAVFDEQCRT